MSDELKSFQDMENTDIEDVTENDVPSAEPEIASANTVDSVTEADVVAAFNEAEKSLGVETVPDNVPAEDVPQEQDEIESAAADRNQFVAHFQMDLNLDDIPDADGMGNDEVTELAEETPESSTVAPTVEPEKEELEEKPEENAVVPTSSKSRGCLLRLVFALLILLISVALATVITTAVFDITGFNRNNEAADVVIPKGADTDKVASILKEEGMIQSEMWFRLYCRVMNVDNKWQAGSFSLQADMGFPTLINTMQAKPPRKTVRVTFPEGLTVPEMAELLEKNKVCSASDFINAVRYGDFDYDFVRDIPTEADAPEYANRAYRLEGYLFPDTYEFYEGSLGETVVDRMLQNFENKMTTKLLVQIKDSGWTLDQAITFASLIQGEADTAENMKKVSRVLYNRFAPDSGFKKLQLCSTEDYVKYLLALELDTYDEEALNNAYNTYDREGLPIAAINNPGMAAIQAVLNPSDDPDAFEYFYFATDYEPEDGSDKPITYFSKTYEEHKKICKEHDIKNVIRD